MDSIQIRQFDPARDENLLQAVVNLHIDCINFEDALLRYHPPFNEEKQAKILRFWKERFDQIPRGLKVTFIATTTTSGIPKSRKSEGGELELCGLVELGTPEAETGPFRGDVELLMVSPHHRRKGIAKKLMVALEECARQKGRTLLQLGTDAGSTAATYVYPNMGYIKIGTVPGFGITPNSKKLVDGDFFYKHLSPPDVR